MPHSGGGGSHGGGHHGGSHRSGGSRSSNRVSKSYFRGARRYLYYYGGRPNYYYADCGGVYIKHTCVECPHCGAPVKVDNN